MNPTGTRPLLRRAARRIAQGPRTTGGVAATLGLGIIAILMTLVWALGAAPRGNPWVSWGLTAAALATQCALYWWLRRALDRLTQRPEEQP